MSLIASADATRRRNARNHDRTSPTTDEIIEKITGRIALRDEMEKKITEFFKMLMNQTRHIGEIEAKLYVLGEEYKSIKEIVRQASIELKKLKTMEENWASQINAIRDRLKSLEKSMKEGNARRAE